MHFASFEVVSVKILNCTKGIFPSSGLWQRREKHETGCVTWSVFCKPQRRKKCYHRTRIFQPRTKINGPWSEPKKSTCPRTSGMDNILFTFYIAFDGPFLPATYRLRSINFRVCRYSGLCSLLDFVITNNNDITPRIFFRPQHYLVRARFPYNPIHLLCIQFFV